MRASFHMLAVVLVCCAACEGDRTARAVDSVAVAGTGEDLTNAFRVQLGRTWELSRLGNQNIPAPRANPNAQEPRRYPGAGTRPTIRFTSEPDDVLLAGEPGFLRAGGWSFCNGYGTAYSLGPGDRLRFRGFHSTLVGCDGPDSLETRFFRALGSTSRFAFDSGALHLIAEDGSRLIFVAASQMTTSPP